MPPGDFCLTKWHVLFRFIPQTDSDRFLKNSNLPGTALMFLI